MSAVTAWATLLVGVLDKWHTLCNITGSYFFRCGHTCIYSVWFLPYRIVMYKLIVDSVLH